VQLLRFSDPSGAAHVRTFVFLPFVVDVIWWRGREHGTLQSMKSWFRRVKSRLRANVSARRGRKLERAMAEARLREHQEPTIWKSGKGGFHYDH
jgi:hypothetical protein